MMAERYHIRKWSQILKFISQIPPGNCGNISINAVPLEQNPFTLERERERERESKRLGLDSVCLRTKLSRSL